MRALSGEIGISHKQFIERFRRRIGLPPKQFARLIRFDRVISEVQSAPRHNWAEIAARCGFYDQAHFNHEFRAFTGTTPSDFLLARDPSGQSMLVA